MTQVVLPVEGAADPALQKEAHSLWVEQAGKAGVDLTGFDISAPFSARAAWAAAAGLAIGVGYSRYSTQKQGSTADQLRTIVQHAARHGIYTPPEFLCADEGMKGRTQDRPGLNRVKLILAQHLAIVFLVFKLSRLARMVHKAIEFFRETLVDHGLRGIAISDGIDTNDKKVWRLQTALKGAMDEELLDVIGDHVREGLVGLFLKNWATGALPVGYMPIEVPGAPKTRRNLPRMMPSVDEKTGAMILEHYRLVADGHELIGCWKKWRADGGPTDPRSTTGQMSYPAYIRMLQRESYIGRWQFCRKRNTWSGKGDLTQVRQPTNEIQILVCEELRIVPDELFMRVQARLRSQATGPRIKRAKTCRQLHELVIGLFYCACCRGKRFYMAGANGLYMRCQNPECPAHAMIYRPRAVAEICGALVQLLKDAGFVDTVMASFAALTDTDRDSLDQRIIQAERALRQLANKLTDLDDLLGVGTDDQRRQRRDQIKAVAAEHAAAEAELAAFRRQRRGGSSAPITREQVMRELADLLGLLNDAAAGTLGPDGGHRAAEVFRRLVGGQILVHAMKRGGRKDYVVTGTFTPDLIGPVRQKLDADTAPTTSSEPVKVFLVPPPFVDTIAEEVQKLYDTDRIGFRLINRALEAKYARKIGTGNICAARRRYYEMRGLPTPSPRAGKGGRPRKTG